MKAKLSIILLITTMLLVSPSVFAWPWSDSPATAIEAVLKKYSDDPRVVLEADKAAHGASYPEIANTVFSCLKSIDTAQCPEDFRIAFRLHINAWKACDEESLDDSYRLLRAIAVRYGARIENLDCMKNILRPRNPIFPKITESQKSR